MCKEKDYGTIECTAFQESSSSHSLHQTATMMHLNLAALVWLFYPPSTLIVHEHYAACDQIQDPRGSCAGWPGVGPADLVSRGGQWQKRWSSSGSAWPWLPPGCALAAFRVGICRPWHRLLWSATPRALNEASRQQVPKTCAETEHKRYNNSSDILVDGA